MKTKSKNKIVIVDDHLLFSQSLRLLINSFKGFEVVNSFENGKEFISHLEEHNTDQIDIVLLDVNMPILDGLSTIKWLKKNQPHLNVIALSVNDDDETIIKMITNGAKGYLLKDTTPTIFHEAIATVLEKGFYYSELVSSVLVNKIDKRTDQIILKDKEVLFLKLVCTEKTYKQIADDMCLSPKTIDGYRESLFEKLEIKTRVGLVLYAIKNKIVSI